MNFKTRRQLKKEAKRANSYDTFTRNKDTLSKLDYQIEATKKEIELQKLRNRLLDLQREAAEKEKDFPSIPIRTVPLFPREDTPTKPSTPWYSPTNPDPYTHKPYYEDLDWWKKVSCNGGQGTFTTIETTYEEGPANPTKENKNEKSKKN